MANDNKKKKPRRVSTVFNRQRVNTTPEIAERIKSGEISPSTHTFSQTNGEVTFTPRRSAVVGGTGIMPSASVSTGGGSIGASTVSGVSASRPFPSAVSAANTTTPQATVSGPQSSRRQATVNTARGTQTNSPSASTATQAATSRMGAASVRAADGSEVSPSQATAMSEQHAARIAPVKADVSSLMEEVNSLMMALDEASDEAQIQSITTRINALKSAISGPQN